MKRVIIANDGVTVANVAQLAGNSPAGTGTFVNVSDDTPVAPYWTWNKSTSNPVFTYGEGPATSTTESRLAAVELSVADALTGADRQQAVRVQVTPDANGRAVFVYPKAYVSGTKPAVTTTAETPSGAAYRNDASVEENSATNTQVVILVQRIPKTLVVNLLGAVLSIVSPVTTPVWINVLVRAPV